MGIREREPVLTVKKAAMAAALALSGLALASCQSNPSTFNPEKKVKVIERHNPGPGDYRLRLEQCGFSLLNPEADDRGCYWEEHDVTRQQYDAYPVESSLQLEDLGLLR